MPQSPDDQRFHELMQALAAGLAVHPPAKRADETAALLRHNQIALRLRRDRSAHFDRWQYKKLFRPAPPPFDLNDERDRITATVVDLYGERG